MRSLEEQLQQELDYTWQTRQIQPTTETQLARWMAEHHAVLVEPIQFLRRGSGIVFGWGTTHFIKCYAPTKPYHLQRERYGLHYCQHQLPVQLPSIEAAGQIGHWPYLVLSRLTGHYLVDVWEQLSLDNKCQIAHQLGQLMRTFHQLPLAPLPELNMQPAELALRSQRLTDAYLHRLAWGLCEHQLPVRWLDTCLVGIQEGLALLAHENAPVLLHRNMGLSHLMVSQQASVWQITGLLDFNGIMQGPGLAEFAVPLIRLYEAPLFLHRMLLGYGFQSIERNLSLAKQLATLMLLNSRFDSLWLIPMFKQVQKISWEALVRRLCYFLWLAP